jgi:hypothetical protein
MSYQQLGATDAGSSILELQKQINRFARAGKFTPVVTDGAFGTRTQQGVYSSLRWILGNMLVDQSFRASAENYIATWDGKAGAQLALIGFFLGNVANQIGLPAASATTPPRVSTAPPTLPGFQLTPPSGGGVATSITGAFANLSTVGKLALVAGLGVVGYLLVGGKPKKKGKK